MEESVWEWGEEDCVRRGRRLVMEEVGWFWRSRGRSICKDVSGEEVLPDAVPARALKSINAAGFCCANGCWASNAKAKSAEGGTPWAPNKDKICSGNGDLKAVRCAERNFARRASWA